MHRDLTSLIETMMPVFQRQRKKKEKASSLHSVNYFLVVCFVCEGEKKTIHCEILYHMLSQVNYNISFNSFVLFFSPIYSDNGSNHFSCTTKCYCIVGRLFEYVTVNHFCCSGINCTCRYMPFKPAQLNEELVPAPFSLF